MPLAMARRLPVLCAGLVALAAVAADWPQFLGPERNGISAEKDLLFAWPKMGPPVLWEKQVGSGLSGPAIAGGRLLLFHRVGDREVVQCLDAASGADIWQHAYPTAYQDDFGKDDGPRATPLVADGRVITLGAEGRLVCLSLADGTKAWERSLNEEYRVRKGFFGVATSPLLEEGLVLVNVGGRGAGIVAFDSRTGREVWKATDDEASYSSPTVATLAGVRHAVFFTREGVVLLDPRTGQVRYSKRWRARINASVNAATPLVAGDLVFVSSSYNTGALVLQVGQDAVREVWHGDEALSNHYNTSIHHDGYLYGLDGRQEEGPRLRCVELRTGKVRWSREQFGCASGLWVDGHLLFLTEQGELVLVEATPEAYREKARATVLGPSCRAQIALADGRLYGRDARKLVCWNLRK